jgi:hypothetical protein
VNVPVARYGCIVPSAIEASGGDTVIDTSVAGTTVIVVCPETDPTAATICVVPVPTATARPALSMLATAVSVDNQFAAVVTF